MNFMTVLNVLVFCGNNGISGVKNVSFITSRLHLYSNLCGTLQLGNLVIHTKVSHINLKQLLLPSFATLIFKCSCIMGGKYCFQGIQKDLCMHLYCIGIYGKFNMSCICIIICVTK